METGIALIVAFVGSTALWQFVTFLIDRFDKKKKSTNDIAAAVDEVNQKIDGLSQKINENQAVLARTHILRFSDELQNGIHHSNEYFRQQLQDCDTYERFCEEHPEFKNSYTELANKHIKDTYARLLEEGKFTKED